MPKMTNVSPNVEQWTRSTDKEWHEICWDDHTARGNANATFGKSLCEIAGESRDTQEQQCSRLRLSQGILELRHANELYHISFSMVRRSHQTQTGCSRRPRQKLRCSLQARQNFAQNPTQKRKAYRHKLATTPCALWTWKARRRRSSTESHSNVPTHLTKQ